MPGAIPTMKWVRDLVNLFMPIGTILLWGGTVASIPAGWALCNGQVSNGVVTPNLSGRFVLQTDQATYPVGAAGGSYTHLHNLNINGTVLTVGQMPYHTHGITDPGHRHQLRMSTGTGSGYGAARGSSGGTLETDPSLSSDTTNISLGYAGGNEAHSHTGNTTTESLMPPYYALCYIQRTALLT